MSGLVIQSDQMVGFSDDTMSFESIVFGFLEEREDSLESSCGSSVDYANDDDGNENCCDFEENKKFWEEQNKLLQATLYRTSSLETKIRQLTKEALREIKDAAMPCNCQNAVAGSCRDCLQREIHGRLKNEGYDCAICKSKWNSYQDIPPGEHTYLEVVYQQSTKKGEVRVVIELNFRAEFEMAKASEDYNELINKLPEVFVGKAERLKDVIKVLCSSARKCMKDKNMHLGPWRKHKYMQSKWLGQNRTEQRLKLAPLPVGFSGRQQKARASMLTCDLSDSLPVLHCTAVKVV